MVDINQIRGIKEMSVQQLNPKRLSRIMQGLTAVYGSLMYHQSLGVLPEEMESLDAGIIAEALIALDKLHVSLRKDEEDAKPWTIQEETLNRHDLMSCGNCPFSDDRELGMGRLFCTHLDKVVRSHHHESTDCLSVLAPLRPQTTLQN